MDYQVFQPHALLKPFVASIWIATGTGLGSQKIVSDGHSELIFHFGDAYQIQKEGRWQIQPSSIVAGQINKPIHLQPTGSSGMIGIKFKPTALWRLFHWNMQSLTNEALPLQEFFSSSVLVLQDQIQHTKTHRSRIDMMENFLLRQLNRVTHKPALDPLCDRITTCEGVISMRALAREYKLSVRTLERMFNEQVGVSAKAFSRIIRFKKVYSLLQQPALNTAQVSYLCGYFDQSHLNKDFKKFTGEDPQKYFSETHSFARFHLTSK